MKLAIIIRLIYWHCSTPECRQALTECIFNGLKSKVDLTKRYQKCKVYILD